MLPQLTIDLRELPFSTEIFFKILNASLKDSRGFFRTMARSIFQHEIAQNFLKQMPPDTGRKWAPLKFMTQQIRIKRGYHPLKPILVQSGYMRDSVISGKPKYENITQHTYRIGVKGRHGQAHILHYGGDISLPGRGKGHIEARPFFLLSNSGIRFLVSKYLQFITAGLIRGVSKASLAEYKGGARISALPGM